MKRIKIFLSALMLSMSSVLMFAAPHAFAATRTWDGGGSDNNMTTAANWSSDTAPSAGDDLVFPVDITDRTIVNDFTAATSFNSLAFTGTATQASDYSFSGNSMTLVAGITNTMTGSFATSPTISMALILNGTQTFNAGSSSLTISGTLSLGSSALTFAGSGYPTVSGVISGTGSITKTGTGDLTLTADTTYSGTTTLSAGNLVAKHANALGTSAGGTTVASGAALHFIQATEDVTVAEPLTLNGTGGGQYIATLNVALSYNQSATPVTPHPLTTFTGAITLGSDVTLYSGGRDGKITGAITGSHALSLLEASTGTFEIASSANGSATPNSVLAPPTKETTYADNSPSTAITVNTNETAIVTGTYGAVSVNSGGTLKGTGTVGNVIAYGTVAPGLSPGCLNTGDLTFGSTGAYDFEIGGTTACTEYDQIKVTGTVSLGNSSLNLDIVNSFKPVAGQKYILISNDGTDAVNDTFLDLAQGATFTVDGYTFSVSYTGGDGNDVELTVTATPPATGFAFVANSPFVSSAIILAAAGAIAFMARRTFKPAVARRKR